MCGNFFSLTQRSTATKVRAFEEWMKIQRISRTIGHTITISHRAESEAGCSVKFAKSRIVVLAENLGGQGFDAKLFRLIKAPVQSLHEY
jgi:hypothetical protein